jgi:2-desacetyl-2-hydroxyethyl bacteriochlorophyllide A dehydrogenase
MSARPMMTAVEVERPGKISLVELERPQPGPDEVLVRVAAVGICGSDVELLRGSRPAPYVRYPIIPGHEWSGEVVGLGAGVAGVEAGEHVVAEGFRACGRCDRCKEGRTNLCLADYAETGFTHAGAFAEYISVPARLLHRLPPNADLSAAALLEPAACVAQGLLEAELRPGMRVAVVGAGTLGLLAVSMLKLVSPARLALVGTRSDRLALGRELGATDAFDIKSGDPVEAFGDDFDLVFEAASRPEGAQTAVKLARRGATVVFEGISGDQHPSLVTDLVPLKHLRVQGIFGASGAAWRFVVQLFSAGQVEFGRLVTHRFPLEEHERAFAALQDRSAAALKVHMVP